MFQSKTSDGLRLCLWPGVRPVSSPARPPKRCRFPKLETDVIPLSKRQVTIQPDMPVRLAPLRSGNSPSSLPMAKEPGGRLSGWVRPHGFLRWAAHNRRPEKMKTNAVLPPGKSSQKPWSLPRRSQFLEATKPATEATLGKVPVTPEARTEAKRALARQPFTRA